MSLSVEQQLAAALAECERLRAENRQLRERQGLPQVVETAAQSTANTVEFNSAVAVVTSKSGSDEKVKLFRSLFRGREDVHAARWEGRNGKTGYSPAHRKTWSNSFQKRPDEPKEYFPLTDQVIHDHLAEVETLVRDAERSDEIIGIRRSVSDDDSTEDPWTLPPSRRIKDQPIPGPLPPSVKFVRSNLIYVEKEGLPSAMLNRLHRLTAFQNPEFYRAQAMRLSTFGKPRVIRCAEEFPKHIALPRGCLNEITTFFKSHNVSVQLDDQRFVGSPIEVKFHGQLRPEQQSAANAMLTSDDGILCATTAFGKTVIAAWLIAARKVNTLVLVHRRQLLDQWRERLAAFLNLPVKSIGQIGGGRRRADGIIDVAVIQSLNRKQVVDDLVANYGHVIVDECHHLSAVSFEQVLLQVKARYITGLTATPQRKDGHHPIIVMQCGPIRHRVDAKAQALARPFNHIVIPRPTNFRLSPSTEKPEMHELYAALADNKARNDLICVDLMRSIKAGRSPILLTERTSQVDEFASRLTGLVKHIVVLKGGMGAKQRRAIVGQLTSIPDDEERVLLATGRYIGEGFDDARLDTLFLAMPISWRGTLQQYVGRLHRLHDNKRKVVVYDYVDGCVPVLSAMYSKRVRGYEAVGYQIQDDLGTPL